LRNDLTSQREGERQRRTWFVRKDKQREEKRREEKRREEKRRRN
jgi:hypothetical protein